MALVACKECGHAIADSAVSCPQCGVAHPSGLSGQVTIQRRRQLNAAARTMEVFVDERSHGYVKSGGELTVSVVPGEHEIVVVGAGQSCGGIIDVGA